VSCGATAVYCGATTARRDATHVDRLAGAVATANRECNGAATRGAAAVAAAATGAAAAGRSE